MNKIFYLAASILLLLFVQCQKESADSNPQSTEEITPDNALVHYLENSDEIYEWQLEDSISVNNSAIYQVKLTSQTWRDLVWEHSLSIIVPDEIQHNGALLFISGGNNRNDDLHPGNNDQALQAVAAIAQQNKAVTALIKQVPNQPLFGGKTEDEIISYTFHNYQEDGDYTWPLLFPMVKSVIKGMDTVQSFVDEKKGITIENFMLTGYSKRGWTTWLTGATDDRVQAIAPSVIDVLNMPLNVDYQVKTWGDYSIEIHDYVRLGIAQDINKPEGAELVTMVDPFSYRESLTMPKLLLIGANDPYWPADAVKNYFGELEGQNYIHYTPNAGHDLNDGREATPVTSEFFYKMLNGKDYPEFTYDITETDDGFEIDIISDDPFQTITQWEAYSSDRDFRDENWSDQTISGNGTTFSTTVSKPDDGYYATYLNVVYKGDVLTEFPLSTRMIVADKDSVFLDPME